MKSFGHLLRHYRRQCTDSLRGGMLTQARLGELLGDQLGHTGYSGAAVSDWERDKSKIHADDRLVLVGLIAVLYQGGGLQTEAEADAFLAAGNYRAMDDAEQARVFGSLDGGHGRSPPIPEIAAEPALPAAELLTPERRKQLVLLEKVAHFWVQGVLEKSVGSAVLLDVPQERCDTAVDSPWQEVMHTAVTEPISQPILETYLETDRALLILGAPGSGKTTTLITLAQALIHRARADETDPIPVILNLASWAEKRYPLAKWIEEELTAKYQIPRNMGREWVEQDALVLLLDGLDEVNRAYMDACIQAINHFRQDHGLAGLVVCGREEDYEGVHTQLKLGGAVRLRPLTTTQVERYLTAVGIPLDRARSAMARDAILREMAQSPLMLRVLSDSYQPDTAVAEPPQLDAAARRQEVFDVYVEQMFARRGPLTHAPRQTKAWLAWLARKMSLHNQALFLLEQIQPSWLPTRRHQQAFIITSRVIDGISLGVVIWMFWLLVRLTLPGFDSIWSSTLTGMLRFPVPPLSLALFLLIYLVLGVLAGVVDVFFYERRARLGNAFVPNWRKEWKQTAVVVLVVSLASFALVGLFRSPLVGFASSLFTGLSFALTTYFIHGVSYRSDIRTVEALSWSWRGALVGLLVGLMAGALFETIEFQVAGPTPIFRTVFSITLLFILLGGLRGNRLPTTSTPNQGIRLSAGSAMASAALFAIVMSLTTAFFWGGSFGAIAGIVAAWVAGALYGAGSVINHFWLRLWLIRLGRIPWHYPEFLDEAANRVILHKVGGGYMFIHRLLQEHFADMPPMLANEDV